jgi:hypothetical protein
MLDTTGRHPSTQHFTHLFDHEHLPEDLAAVSQVASTTAQLWIDSLKDGPELTTALRKLLEAKDAAVRQRVLDRL